MENIYDKKISTAIPIWTLLKMTEQEYIQKYSQPFVSNTNDKKNIDKTIQKQ